MGAYRPWLCQLDDAWHTQDFFSEAAFGSVLPVPQFNVLEHLDAPWVDAVHLPKLHAHWREVSERLADWTDNPVEDLLPSRPQER